MDISRISLVQAALFQPWQNSLLSLALALAFYLDALLTVLPRQVVSPSVCHMSICLSAVLMYSERFSTFKLLYL